MKSSRHFKITDGFEPERWRDFVLIPWWWFRYWLFWAVAQMWCYRWNKRQRTCRRWWDLYPVYCERCLWTGPKRWLVHAYKDDGTGMDVEAMDECPRCGMEV